MGSLFEWRSVDADDRRGLTKKHWDGRWRVPHGKYRQAVRIGRPGDPGVSDSAPFDGIVYQGGARGWVGYSRRSAGVRVEARTMNQAIDLLEQAEAEAEARRRARPPTSVNQSDVCTPAQRRLFDAFSAS